MRNRDVHKVYVHKILCRQPPPQREGSDGGNCGNSQKMFKKPLFSAPVLGGLDNQIVWTVYFLVVSTLPKRAHATNAYSKAKRLDSKRLIKGLITMKSKAAPICISYIHKTMRSSLLSASANVKGAQTMKCTL